MACRSTFLNRRRFTIKKAAVGVTPESALACWMNERFMERHSAWRMAQSADHT
jgi:hypothetical protein